MFGGSNFRCMAYGTDVWDVARFARVGAVIVCDRCIGVSGDAVADTERISGVAASGWST